MLRASLARGRGGREEMEARLSSLALQQEERLARHRAETLHFPYVDLFTFPLDGNVLKLLPKEQAEEAQAVLFYKRGKDVRVGAVNPTLPVFVEQKEELEQRLGLELQVFVISHYSLNSALTRYPKKTGREGLRHDELRIGEEEVTEFEKNIKDLKTLGDRIANIAPSRILAAIVAGAVKMRASDIHLEPLRDEARLRYRVDGVLQEVATLGLEGWRQVLSRVKVLSDLKLNIRSSPQEGSFVLRVNSQRYDIRVSILPGSFGEYIVLRLLHRKAKSMTLAELGMKDVDREVVLAELKQSTGMILSAGPTGSGKTTTIVACIGEINKPELKVISLEDPIEYRLSGVEQTEINPDTGYTFAAGLRSILRQDPDVIFVGEMRDAETAETSVHAAMTGHLVFSTMHANDAPGVILRLENIGVSSVVIAPALNLVIAQRLVRVVCKECAEEYTADRRMREHIGEVMEGLPRKVLDSAVLRDPKLSFLRAKGCEKCGNTGYKGRIGVFELFAVKGEIEELILRGADGGSIKAAATKAGMTTIAQDAYLKVIDKITTVDEVERISEE